MTGIGQSLVKVVLQGTLATVQSWSTSFWLDLGDPAPQPSQAALDAYAAAITGAMATPVGTIATALFGSTTKTTQVELYWYNPNTIHAAMVATPQALVKTGGGGADGPLFTALVASMRSLTPGRSGRGRCYWPLTIAGPTGAGGQVGAATCSTLATQWAGVLTAVNALPAGGAAPLGQAAVVASFTKGIGYPINHVTVDSIPDTQHRRSDKLVATTVKTVGV